MELDLVHHGHDRGSLHDFFQMVGLKVADADGLDFSLVIQLLKGFPGFAVVFNSFPARFWEWANESDKGPDLSLIHI